MYNVVDASRLAIENKRWQRARFPVVALMAACLLTDACAKAEAPPPLPGKAASVAQPAKVDSKTARALDIAAEPTTRRVIRNAELTLEVTDQAAAAHQLAALAEQLHGFTVNSERQEMSDSEGATFLSLDITVRVPSEKFDEFLSKARSVSSRVASETTTGKDVTEEFIDLDARIRTERALEAQYLDIMKGARTVKDALDVHARLADVREQIEKAEGRKRFLENETSLSTIHLSIRKYVPEIRAQGFGIASSARRAVSDLVSVSAALVSGIVRTLGVLVPLGIILGGPAYLFFRLVRRLRQRRNRLASVAGADL